MSGLHLRSKNELHLGKQNLWPLIRVAGLADTEVTLSERHLLSDRKLLFLKVDLFK